MKNKKRYRISSNHIKQSLISFYHQNIKGFFRSLRSFLERNKIFFETIVVAALSVIAVIVSVSANQIAQRQAIIEEALAMPNINVEMILSADGSQLDGIRLLNDGGALQDYDLMVIPIYNVRFSLWDAQQSPISIRSFNTTLDLLGPFSSVFSVTKNSARTGLLGTVTYGEDASIYVEDMIVFKDFQQKSSVPELHLERMALNFYLVVHHTDIFGNKRTDYFQCITGKVHRYTDIGDAYEANTFGVFRISPETLDNYYQNKQIIQYVHYRETPTERYENLINTLFHWASCNKS